MSSPGMRLRVLEIPEGTYILVLDGMDGVSTGEVARMGEVLRTLHPGSLVFADRVELDSDHYLHDWVASDDG